MPYMHRLRMKTRIKIPKAINGPGWQKKNRITSLERLFDIKTEIERDKREKESPEELSTHS